MTRQELADQIAANLIAVPDTHKYGPAFGATAASIAAAEIARAIFRLQTNSTDPRNVPVEANDFTAGLRAVSLALPPYPPYPPYTTDTAADHNCSGGCADLAGETA